MDPSPARASVSPNVQAPPQSPHLLDSYSGGERGRGRAAVRKAQSRTQKRRLSRKGFSAAGTGVTSGSSLACASQKARSSAAACDTCGRGAQVHAPLGPAPSPPTSPGPRPSRPRPTRPREAPPLRNVSLAKTTPLESGPRPFEAPPLVRDPPFARAPRVVRLPPTGPLRGPPGSDGALSPRLPAPAPAPLGSDPVRVRVCAPTPHLHAVDVYFQLQLLHRLAGLGDLGHVVGHGWAAAGAGGRPGARGG